MRSVVNASVLGAALVLTVSCSLISQPAAPTALPSTTTSLPPVAPTLSPATQVPTPSAEPAPTSLNPRGPYILFEGPSGIWLANPDGSYIQRLSDTGVGLIDLHRALSPQGDRLAYIGGSDAGPTLVLLGIPDGHSETVTLLEAITASDLQANPIGARALAFYTITKYDNLAWQPANGRMLAFIGAQGGPTADLYTYDLSTKEIIQRTSGPSQALYPTWSPDGRYILHFGGSWVPPFGGAIVGYNRMDGAWAVRVDDGKVLTQPKPKGFHQTFVGWQDDRHYLIYDADDACFSRNLHTVNVETLETAPVFSPCFYFSAERSPENGAILFSAQADCPDCALGEGTFLLLPSEAAPRRVLDKMAVELRWLVESDVFFAYPEALLSADGTTRYDPPVYDSSYDPAISRKGFAAWEVIEDRKGRVVVQVPGGEFHTVFDGLVSTLIWDPLTGDTLLIASSDGKLYAATFPDFAPRLVANLDGSVTQAIWTP